MVENKHLNKGLHGDIVEVLVGEKKYKNRYEGKVINVLKRNKKVFVGVFENKRLRICKHKECQNVHRLLY